MNAALYRDDYRPSWQVARPQFGPPHLALYRRNHSALLDVEVPAWSFPIFLAVFGIIQAPWWWWRWLRRPRRFASEFPISTGHPWTGPSLHITCSSDRGRFAYYRQGSAVIDTMLPAWSVASVWRLMQWWAFINGEIPYWSSHKETA